MPALPRICLLSAWMKSSVVVVVVVVIDSLIQSISNGTDEYFMVWYNFALKGMDGLMTLNCFRLVRVLNLLPLYSEEDTIIITSVKPSSNYKALPVVCRNCHWLRKLLFYIL